MLLKEVLRKRPFDHAQKTMLRKKCWIHISETLRKYYGIEVSDRAVCLRTKDLIIKYRAQQEGSRFREPKSNELKDLLYDNSNMF